MGSIDARVWRRSTWGAVRSLPCVLCLCGAVTAAGCGGRASEDAEANRSTNSTSGGSAGTTETTAAGGLSSTATAESAGGTAASGGATASGGTAGIGGASGYKPCSTILDVLQPWELCGVTTQSLALRSCVVPLERPPLDLGWLNLALDCEPIPSLRGEVPVWHYDPEMVAIVIVGAECDAIQRGELTRADVIILCDDLVL